MNVFSINFVRREVVPWSVRQALSVGLVAYLAVQAVLLVGLLGTSGINAISTARLKSRLHQQMPTVAAQQAVRREMGGLSDQAEQELTLLNTALTLRRERFPVGSKLAVLARTLPARTWITQLTGDGDGRTLTIEASYVMDPNAPYDLPAKPWVAALKDDPQFAQGLRRLDLGSTAKKSQGGADLFTFRLTAEWSRS